MRNFKIGYGRVMLTLVILCSFDIGLFARKWLHMCRTACFPPNCMQPRANQFVSTTIMSQPNLVKVSTQYIKYSLVHRTYYPLDPNFRRWALHQAGGWVG